jgi:hypothetical protein
MVSLLGAVWEAAGYPWSVRLKALLPSWMPWIRQRYKLSGETERQLLGISARQIDRRLQGKKRQCKRRQYGRTRPGTLLKHHIPVKTDSWNVSTPGYAEIDLVSHSGNSGEGEFGHTLNLTDIHTGWTESRALLGKGQAGVQQALQEIQGSLPFRLLGLDSDNGSEFINWHLAPAESDSADAGEAVQEGRQCPHRAEELDACAQTAGVGAVRNAGGGGSDERSVPAGAAAVAEPVSAVGKAGEQGARRVEGAAGV